MGNGTVVIRADEHGCFAMPRPQPFIRFPTYYDPKLLSTTDMDDGSYNCNIVDPTGAGNAFLEGFAVVLVKTGRIADTAAYCAVRASFALEQLGPPKFKHNR